MKAPYHPGRIVTLIILLAVVTLACALGGSVSPVTTQAVARLPTLTSTPQPELASTTARSTSPSPATAVPPPVETPTPIATSTPYAGGWIFSGVRQASGQVGDLQVYGDALNDSSASVEVKAITGAFYDDLGQVIADGATSGRWPAVLVPPGGRIPFVLTVPGLTSAASFDLRIEAQANNASRSQDFEFSGVTQSSEGSNTCLSGQLRASRGEVHAYLVIAAILFDNRDKVINYNDERQDAPTGLSGGQIREVKICLDGLDQTIARYELRAWGQ